MAELTDQIIEMARWAPSGDNEQPWRFEVINDQHLVVHAHDTSDWCVYDLDGRASQTAVGALLETISIVASGSGFSAVFEPRATDFNRPVIDVYLKPCQGLKPSPLLPFIKERVTQRRPFTTRALTSAQKQELEAAVGEGYGVIWIEGSASRWKMARLLFRSAHIRLTIPEAYEVHRQNIQWDARYSEDRIPDQAVGVDSMTLKVMRWTLQSWRRVQIMNRYFAGTLLPRLQMDLLPGYKCAAHFIIVSKQALDTTEKFFNGGRALQRFWLTATSLNLQFQPEMTPVIFSRYSSSGVTFTKVKPALARAHQVSVDLGEIIGMQKFTDFAVFMGRVGIGRRPLSRSLRLEIDKLSHPTG